MGQIIIADQNENRDVLLAYANGNKDVTSRLTRFSHWLDETVQVWHNPNLAAYRDHLLAEGLIPASVAAHLSTIRGCYGRLIHDNSTRDRLYSLTPASALVDERKAFVDEAITRLENAINPEHSRVKITTIQDMADSDHLRLTIPQANALLSAPGVKSLRGLRDTTIIALLLCTGIREAELCALDVDDLAVELGGQLAIRIRHGKGNKSRLIPLGDLDWVLVIVRAWLDKAAITDGSVFRSFIRNGRAVSYRRLSVRGIEDILARYPASVSGQMRAVRPHDCRRTYARLMYEAGMALTAIQQNLGHCDVKTTLAYIGTLDASQRRGKAVYTFDLAQLRDS